MRIARIAVPTPLRRVFDYLVPDSIPLLALTELKPGVRVSVPFGRSRKVGVLLELVGQTSVPLQQLKSIDKILDQTPVLSQHLLSLLSWASTYYHYPIGEVVLQALPVLLRQQHPPAVSVTECWCLTDQGRAVDRGTLARSHRQVELLNLLGDERDGLAAERLNALSPNWRPVMKKILQKGWVVCEERSGQDSLVEESTSEGPTGTQEREPGNILNAAQQDAVSKVLSQLNSFSPCLLEGVTGSGKTEVYLSVIEQVVSQQKQTLVLVPEIGLTPQLVQRFKSRFPDTAMAILHSGLNDKERLKAWMRAHRGEARIVIGTRSAITTSMPELGLIIIDEEHDLSYKQQDRFRYSARDVAIKRAQMLNIPIILGSATPALESLQNALSGRYLHLLLPYRAGLAQQPRVQIVDVRSQQLNQGLSAQLIHAIKTQLQQGSQVMLFLNRRGFSPTLLCHDCGWIAKCLRCDSNMTLYQSRSRLRCQHCGTERRLDEQCPDCQSEELIAVGQGTERIEEVLADLFPDTTLLRIDRDTTRRKSAMQAMVEEVQKGEPCILVGTQMLAKGHHFPNVTLVGIVNADQGLFSADFRGAERMAQLLIQVSGRAGRAEKKGEVIIQTHHPGHPLLQELIQNGYDGFAAVTLQERQVAGLPPYSHMVLLRAEATDRQRPFEFLNAARQMAEHCLGDLQLDNNSEQVELFGPIPAPMEKRAGRFRAQLLLQATERKSLQKLLSPWLRQLETDKSGRQVRWSIDVDPLDIY